MHLSALVKTPMPEIRVLLADDQRLMREGLRVLLDLTSDIRVVGEAGDGVELETSHRQLQAYTVQVTLAYTPERVTLPVPSPRPRGGFGEQTCHLCRNANNRRMMG